MPAACETHVETQPVQRLPELRACESCWLLPEVKPVRKLRLMSDPTSLWTVLSVLVRQ